MKLSIRGLMALTLAQSLLLVTLSVPVLAAPPAKVTVCHAAGQAGTTHFITLEVPANDGGFPQGHFTEGGTQAAGHEEDYLGPCASDTEPTPEPTAGPTATPTASPSDAPSPSPTAAPSDAPSPEPSPTPSVEPTLTPTSPPSPRPTHDPKGMPETDSETTPPSQPGSGSDLLVAMVILAVAIVGSLGGALMARRALDRVEHDR